MDYGLPDWKVEARGKITETLADEGMKGTALLFDRLAQQYVKEIKSLEAQLAAVRELPEKWKRFDHSTWRFSPSYILVTLTDELEAALNGEDDG